MLDHHVQRAIVYRLAFSEGLRFSELKPDTLENKLFDYHLKKVVAAGYAMKGASGLYSLTPEGRLLGIRALDKQQALADQAESVLFLIIRQAADGAWLFYKRGTHPMLGYSGFMHASPNAHEDSTITAAKSCLEKTGLRGDFTALGGGYSRIFNKSGELQSFTNFSLLFCNNIVGELSAEDAFADYRWELSPDFADAQLFPSTVMLHELYDAGKPFFIERNFTI
jgi:hypothetical protein